MWLLMEPLFRHEAGSFALLLAITVWSVIDGGRTWQDVDGRDGRTGRTWTDGTDVDGRDGRRRTGRDVD